MKNRCIFSVVSCFLFSSLAKEQDKVSISPNKVIADMVSSSVNCNTYP